MKKNLVYLVVFVALLVVVGMLTSEREERSTLEGKENYAFAIKDTAEITRIELRDKTPSEATIKRVKGQWLVNGKYPVRQEAIDFLMEAFYRMEMRNFPPQRMIEVVEQKMEVFGTQVKVYSGDRLLKSYTIGLPTQDEMGTWMKLDGGDVPYAVHIPGFNGYLNPRFITKEHIWKRRDLATINPRNIKSVEMSYPDSLSASFTLEVFSPDSFTLRRASDGYLAQNLTKAEARLYLNNFKNLRYEGDILPTEPIYQDQDSLLASTPVFRCSIRNMQGKTHSFSGYKIKAESQTIDPANPKTFYDPDRLHGFINDEEMVLLQYYGLRNVLKTFNDFEKN